ncbi:MAG TPA: helix-turn-helix domain-containing protein, partial [Chitinophagaceae bacterium]|nr:helix-turn-helix domain-containing protein [Chitinophagaceae bacterium]
LGIKGYIISHREFVLKKSGTPPPALPATVVKEAIAALKKAMETDKLYLNPSLNLDLASRHTALAPKIISAVLNQHLHKSFNEFVNEYRVLAVKEKLLKEENRQLTIAGLAYECGFNSLPTFQRAFKTVTGLTPKEFLAKNP